MAATHTLNAEARETVQLNGHKAHAPDKEVQPEPKRNGRKQRKGTDDSGQTLTPDATNPPQEVPDLPNDATTGSTEASPPTPATEESPAPTTTADENPPENPATPQVELNTTESALVSGDAEEEKPAVTLTPEVIANYAREAGVRPFQDQHSNAFASIPVGDGEHQHRECLRIRSTVFRSRLLELINSRTESIPKVSAVKQAIEIMELEAYRSPKEKLDNRRTTVGGEVFVDLGDEDWRMIHANRDGWKAMPQDQPRFFRPQHMLSLPEPERGGDLDELFSYVPTENDGDKLLLTAWTVGGLYSAIPTPILLIVGQQGAAKTTRSRRLRSLLDPSITPVQGDLEMSNLFLTFQHHAVPCFENVSHFNRREADMFCRAVTGNGVERRKLYTDGDQVLYSFRRPIIINGIDTPSTRPDFLDRCVIYNCRRMDQFIPLEELDRQFEAARPRLFGAMLDLLVKTLEVLHSTPPATEFRMADFARFGRAVAVALGRKPEDFDNAYRMNIQQQNFEVLEDAPMSKILERFGKKQTTKPWVGTADELLIKLREEARLLGDSNATHDLPKSARWLSSRLGELAPALANRGVYITKLPRTNAKRLWQISTSIPEDPNAEPDSIFEQLEALAEEESKNQPQDK